MAAECSHKDETRKGVSSTAHGVSSIRGMEFDKDPSERLFTDPYASLLGGEVGKNFLEVVGRTGKDGKPVYGLIDGMAVRTKKIDDEFNASSLVQICVFGAGLDARPWRLKKTVEQPVHYFEVDFPEIFEYKLSTLATVNATTEFEYHYVNTDLSLGTWVNDLINAGYDVNKPTLFIMEGLINYLTEDEANAFFHTISTQLAAKGSKLVSTCCTPTVKTTTNMHRFFPENPLVFVNAHGWVGEQEDIESLGERFNRPIRDSSMKGYYLITAELK